MGNSLRCCLACVLPCGTLDLIRIVHNSGHVDQYSHPVSAAEILSANPNHVLSKPCSDATATVRRIIIVSPDSDLKRGHIYFLVPSSSLSQKMPKKKKTTMRSGSDDDNTRLPPVEEDGGCRKGRSRSSPAKHTLRRRKSGRVGVWRQQLESIAED